MRNLEIVRHTHKYIYVYVHIILMFVVSLTMKSRKLRGRLMLQENSSLTALPSLLGFNWEGGANDLDSAWLALNVFCVN